MESRKHQQSVGKPNVAQLNCILSSVVHSQHCSLMLIIKVTALILPTIITFCLCFFQEPLNSEDDVSDEEGQELFDTENVVVCQYDKVNIYRKQAESFTFSVLPIKLKFLSSIFVTLKYRYR